MLHVRDMLPAVPEIVDERVFEVEETEEPVYREVDGLLIETGRTAVRKRGRFVKTGKRVDTGSMKQADLACADCGADLVPAPDDRPFYYLVCGRLNRRDPEGRRPEGARWLLRRQPEAPDPQDRVVWELVESEEPYPDCVLECGRWGL